jgi:hypothetical protein
MTNEVGPPVWKKAWSMVNETQARLWHIVLAFVVATVFQWYLTTSQKDADVRRASITQYVVDSEKLIGKIKSFTDAATLRQPEKLIDARAKLDGTLASLYSKGFTLEAKLSGDDQEAVSAYLNALLNLEKVLPEIDDPSDPQDFSSFFKPVSVLIDAQRRMVEELG